MGETPTITLGYFCRGGGFYEVWTFNIRNVLVKCTLKQDDRGTELELATGTVITGTKNRTATLRSALQEPETDLPLKSALECRETLSPEGPCHHLA